MMVLMTGRKFDPFTERSIQLVDTSTGLEDVSDFFTPEAPYYVIHIRRPGKPNRFVICDRGGDHVIQIAGEVIDNSPGASAVVILKRLGLPDRRVGAIRSSLVGYGQ